MSGHPPLSRVIAELAFRGTIVAFSKAFWDLQLVGADRIPPGPCFLYGNHANNYDPFIVNAFTELGHATSGVMTMEYLEKGPVAHIFKAVGIQGTRKRVPEPHLIRRIYRMLEAGRRVVIYPEGGRRWDGRPAPWIEATAKLFYRAGVPVYPLVTHGSYVSWPRWARWPRPAHVKLEVLPAVDFTGAGTLDEALTRLKAPIDIDGNLVEEPIRPSWAYRPAEGAEKLLYRDPVSGQFGGLQSPDGRRLVGPDGMPVWKMLPDSRLLRIGDGSIELTGDVYARIRSLPIEPDSDGCILRLSADMIRVPEPWLDDKKGTVTVSLRSDDLQIGHRHLPLEQIRYIGLERNDRIWFDGTPGFVALRILPGGSALGLCDTLLRLASHINPNEARPAPNP